MSRRNQILRHEIHNRPYPGAPPKGRMLPGLMNDIGKNFSDPPTNGNGAEDCFSGTTSHSKRTSTAPLIYHIGPHGSDIHHGDSHVRCFQKENV